MFLPIIIGGADLRVCPRKNAHIIGKTKQRCCAIVGADLRVCPPRQNARIFGETGEGAHTGAPLQNTKSPSSSVCPPRQNAHIIGKTKQRCCAIVGADLRVCPPRQNARIFGETGEGAHTG
ncbi:MAG: hypothetical protein RBU37_08075, partial [Myxococcota bacterium]|nr:hypothetical protein [Myxococcota bacterium]